MENSIKTSSPSTQRDDFQTQWQRRQHWEEVAKKSTPDDIAFLDWAVKAQHTSSGSEVNVAPFPSQRNKRWIPYAAAACIALGLTIFGLTRHVRPDDGLPVAQEVTVDNQTIHFICNNGCSAQDVMLLANKAIK